MGPLPHEEQPVEEARPRGMTMFVRSGGQTIVPAEPQEPENAEAAAKPAPDASPKED